MRSQNHPKLVRVGRELLGQPTLQLGTVSFASSSLTGATRAIAAKLALSPSQYTTAFQSRLGPEAWVKPYTSVILEEKAAEGAKRILVFSPAFVADCLETIVEIGTEYQEEFEAMGGERVDLVPSLNDDPRWIRTVAALVTR